MNNLCVAHRGFSGKAPENTMAAFRMAITEPFVQWMEIDTQLTADGIPVVIHDFSLDRTTNGSGKVKDHTWQQIHRLDAGSWKSRDFLGERVPSLEEVLRLSCGRVRLNIELKTSGNMYPGLEKAVIDRVASYHMEQDVVLTSFDSGALVKVKQINPDIKTGLIIDARPKDLVERLQSLQCSFLSIGHPNLDHDLAEKLKAAGITVMGWTVDDARRMKRLADISPEILICTNRPDVWGKTFMRSNSILNDKGMI
ncbi:glycerophosphodiester phosphodiesterase family protein [Paenibacillus dokdonensis]|uniref:Glycerophosphodiester phosphodiesterase family protein n=1 Tax=Paenibacillus dokdonensis TaxID=2567944 RepID=A0ABU6GHB8_9BACL|nr:glycerophosphodiester phosphodiesterase family protein [Paenibacillus dokdonensis]MEC0239130.1 glycerophosphodiester phosphodiesterase family protein [Paenibacillus dokdonensis]